MVTRTLPRRPPKSSKYIMNEMHVKAGDIVVILSGNEKGKKGKVIEAFPKEGLVLVEGLNLKKKHQRPRKAGQKGQILEKAAPIHVSKVRKAEAPRKKGKPAKGRSVSGEK